MARFKLGVRGASCNHPTRYDTVIADHTAHLDEQTLASGGCEDARIKWNFVFIKERKGQKLYRRWQNSLYQCFFDSKVSLACQ